MGWRFQFSLRFALLLVTGLAISLAAIVQVPHIFVFAIGCLFAAAACLAAYRTTRTLRLRFGAVLTFIGAAFTFLATWTLFYILSLGPFIALSEIERKITGHHHIGRLAGAYRPVLAHLNNKKLQSFRWYVSRWIPPDAVGLHALNPARISPDLTGTWKTQSGCVLNLRANGTGLARLYSNPRHYFEWTSEANVFAIHDWGSKRDAFAWFGCEMMNRTWDEYDVFETSTTQFKLRDKTGKIYLVTRIQDTELESAP
jgi:hypothetical protein